MTTSSPWKTVNGIVEKSVLFRKRYQQRLDDQMIVESAVKEVKEQAGQDARPENEYKIAYAKVQPVNQYPLYREEIATNKALDLPTLEYVIMVSGEPGMTLEFLRQVIYKHITLKQSK